MFDFEEIVGDYVDFMEIGRYIGDGFGDSGADGVEFEEVRTLLLQLRPEFPMQLRR